MQRVHAEAIMAQQLGRARRSELLCPSVVLVAPIVHELGTCLQHLLLGKAHVEKFLVARRWRREMAAIGVIREFVSKYILPSYVQVGTLCMHW